MDFPWNFYIDSHVSLSRGKFIISWVERNFKNEKKMSNELIDWALLNQVEGPSPI